MKFQQYSKVSHSNIKGYAAFWLY